MRKLFEMGEDPDFLKYRELVIRCFQTGISLDSDTCQEIAKVPKYRKWYRWMLKERLVKMRPPSAGAAAAAAAQEQGEAIWEILFAEYEEGAFLSVYYIRWR